MITYSGYNVKQFFNQFWVGLVMWEVFELLCEKRGVTTNAVAKANITDAVYTHVSDEWLAEEMKKYRIC